MTSSTRWRFTGVTSSGDRASGTVVAASVQDAESQLVASGVTVGLLEPDGDRRLPSTPVPLGSMVAFAEQMAHLLEGGVPVAEALRVAARATPDPALVEVLDDVAARVADGSQLREAVQHHPVALGEVFVSQLSLAPARVDLAEVFRRLAEDLEADRCIEEEIATALVAPRWSAAMSLIGISVALATVLPVLQAAYDLRDEGLPQSTRILVSIRTRWPLAVTAVVLVGVGLRIAWRATPADRRERLTWRMPVIGATLRLRTAERWVRSASALHRTGVPLSDAFADGAALTGSTMATAQASAMTGRLEDGGDLTGAIEAMALLPPSTRAIIGAGARHPNRSLAALDTAAAELHSRLRRETAGLGRTMQIYASLLIALLTVAVMAGMWLPLIQIVSGF